MQSNACIFTLKIQCPTRVQPFLTRVPYSHSTTRTALIITSPNGIGLIERGDIRLQRIRAHNGLIRAWTPSPGSTPHDTYFQHTPKAHMHIFTCLITYPHESSHITSNGMPSTSKCSRTWGVHTIVGMHHSSAGHAIGG